MPSLACRQGRLPGRLPPAAAVVSGRPGAVPGREESPADPKRAAVAGRLRGTGLATVGEQPTCGAEARAVVGRGLGWAPDALNGRRRAPVPAGPRSVAGAQVLLPGGPLRRQHLPPRACCGSQLHAGFLTHPRPRRIRRPGRHLGGSAGGGGRRGRSSSRAHARRAGDVFGGVPRSRPWVRSLVRSLVEGAPKRLGSPRPVEEEGVFERSRLACRDWGATAHSLAPPLPHHASCQVLLARGSRPGPAGRTGGATTPVAHSGGRPRRGGAALCDVVGTAASARRRGSRDRGGRRTPCGAGTFPGGLAGLARDGGESAGAAPPFFGEGGGEGGREGGPRQRVHAGGSRGARLWSVRASVLRMWSVRVCGVLLDSHRAGHGRLPSFTPRLIQVHVHVIYQDAFPSAGLSNGVAGATDGVHGAAGPASGDEGVEAFGTGRDDDQAASPLSLCSALDSLLGRGPAGLRNLLGASSKDVCVMLSGVRSSDGAELARRLRKAGVHARRILVAERVMAPPPTQAQAPRKSL